MSLIIDRAKFLAMVAALATTASCGNYHTVAGFEGDASSDGEVGPQDSSAPVEASRDSGAAETGTVCGNGEKLCGTTCVDTTTDPLNCGGCGTACTNPGDCWNGQCCYPSAEGPAAGLCVVYPQCGCTSGEMCVVEGASAPQCVPNGTTPENGPCSGVTDCQPNLTCTAGYCQPLCATSSMCAANWACLPQSAGTTALGYSACAAHCNPVASFTSDATHQGCVTGQHCDPLFNATGQTGCFAPTGTGTQGAACTSDNDCAANYLCTGPSGATSYTCYQFCRVGFSDCLSGTCNAFQTPEYDNTQQIGVCE